MTESGHTARVTHNFRVLASLTDLLCQLADHRALVGRYGSRIVIDRSQAPALLLDELAGPFMACYLAAETEDAAPLPVFDSLTAADAGQTVLLDADPVLRQGFEALAQYPALHNIRHLVEVIPPLPQDLADHYAAALGQVLTSPTQRVQ